MVPREMAEGERARWSGRAIGRRLVAWGATLGLAVSALVALVVALGAGRSWAIELLGHFREAHAVLTAAVVLCLFAVRRWLAGAAGVVLVAWLAAPMAAYWWSPGGRKGGVDSSGGALVLMLANLNAGNRDAGAALAAIRAAEPDVLLLMEVTPAWRAALDSLAVADYPHRLEEVRSDAFGIWLLSKRPLEDGRVVDEPSGVPSAMATIAGDGGGRLRLLATHPVPPMGSSMAVRRDRQLGWIARWAAEPTDRRVVVMGDLNCTPFSPHFAELLEGGGLRDTGLGFGLPATWRPGLPGLGIPIDHVLLGDGVRVLDRRVGSTIGSDHRPLIVRVAIDDPGGGGVAADAPVPGVVR